MLLNDLKYIVAVAEEKSFSKASERLLVAQPSLSQSVARVEKQYKCAFFIRTPKGLEITKEGEIYLQHAHTILNMYQQMEYDLSESTNHIEKKLNTGTITNHGSYFFPQTVSRIQRKYPNLSILITEYAKGNLEKPLISGSIDVAVTRLPIRDPEIEYTVLGSEPIIAIMSKDNPLAKYGYKVEGHELPFIDIRLLADAFFLVFPEYDAVAHAVNPIFDYAGFYPKKTLEVRSLELHEKLCESNSYVSFVPLPIWDIIGNNPKVAYFNIEDCYSLPFSLAVATAKKNQPQYVTDYVNYVIQFNELSVRSKANPVNGLSARSKANPK